MNTLYKTGLPADERPTLLFITDDPRRVSGVSHIANMVLAHTAHVYNWVVIGGGAPTPPTNVDPVDISQSVRELRRSEEPVSAILYPTQGYGTPELVHLLIDKHGCEAVLFITDPRQYEWLFDAERSVRKKVPLIYLNIWDSLPYPMYNRPFYRACDGLLAISKQTENINRVVLGPEATQKVIKYVPHGLDTRIFYPIPADNALLQERLRQFRQQLLRGREGEVDFVILFNSRNQRRKGISDLFMAYRQFIEPMTPAQRKKTALIVHSHWVDVHGTDLNALEELLFNGMPEANVINTGGTLTPEELNLLYNMADVVTLPSSNEGWGLSVTEAMLCGKPVVATVTGGLQDQMRFEDENGNWIKFSPEFGSNHRGKFRKHGEWAFPVYPTIHTLFGSPVTPYIFDDFVRPEDIVQQWRILHQLSPQQRAKLGESGRKWAISEEAGFTAPHMASRLIEGIEETLDRFKPRANYDIVRADTFHYLPYSHSA